MKWIKSLDNEIVKEIKRIKKRPKDRIFLEGKHLIDTALFSKTVKVEKILITEHFIKKHHEFLKVLQDQNIPISGLSENIINKISDTVTSQGIFAIARFKIKTIDEVSIKNPSLIVIADTIQDPGNLGTIIRASEALGAQIVLTTNGTCNFLSSKVLRSSAGSIFYIPVVEATIKEIERFIIKNRLVLVVTDPHSKKLSFETDFTKPVAIAFGNESKGVSNELKSIGSISCRIPHKGKSESLNVAMSVSVFLYEIFRQRYLKQT